MRRIESANALPSLDGQLLTPLATSILGLTPDQRGTRGHRCPGRLEVRTREALVEAIGVALSAVASEDVAGWFAHCAYGSEAQIL